MPSLQDFFNFVANEWRMIKCPSFWLAVAIVGGIIYSALSWEYTTQLSNKDSIISVRNATIDQQSSFLSEYREQLKVSTPTEAAQQFSSIKQALADAENEIKKLRERQNLQSGRSLSSSQINRFVETAKTYVGKPPIILLNYAASCFDCSAYDQDFYDMISKVPGWVVRRNGTFLGIRYQSNGITVAVADTGDLSSGANVLINALHAANLKFNVLPGLRKEPAIDGNPPPSVATAAIEINPYRN